MHVPCQAGGQGQGQLSYNYREGGIYCSCNGSLGDSGTGFQQGLIRQGLIYCRCNRAITVTLYPLLL